MNKFTSTAKNPRCGQWAHPIAGANYSHYNKPGYMVWQNDSEENSMIDSQLEMVNSQSNCTRLRAANLRPTRQRLALADLLFAKGDRHVSAENLFEEAKSAGVAISLATVYNTLHQFTESNLLKAIAIDSNRTYFDTNVGDHNHFYIEGTDELIDMPESAIRIENLPPAPDGMVVSGIDLVVRIRPGKTS